MKDIIPHRSGEGDSARISADRQASRNTKFVIYIK